MALDGRITEIEDHPEGIQIHLQDRDSASGPAGQSSMIIVNPTVIPKVGDFIWGGSGFANIVSDGNAFPYRREGYTRLVQDWPRV